MILFEYLFPAISAQFTVKRRTQVSCTKFTVILPQRLCRTDITTPTQKSLPTQEQYTESEYSYCSTHPCPWNGTTSNLAKIIIVRCEDDPIKKKILKLVNILKHENYVNFKSDSWRKWKIVLIIFRKFSRIKIFNTKISFNMWTFPKFPGSIFTRFFLPMHCMS